MFLVLSCSCLLPIQWSQALSREWRCSWSSADRRCSRAEPTGDDPTTSEWLTILLPTKVHFILETWRYILTLEIRVHLFCIVNSMVADDLQDTRSQGISSNGFDLHHSCWRLADTRSHGISSNGFDLHHSCWRLADTRSQGISNNCFDLHHSCWRLADTRSQGTSSKGFDLHHSCWRPADTKSQGISSNGLTCTIVAEDLQIQKARASAATVWPAP